MIKIAVTRYDNLVPIAAMSAVFDHERKTLGRSDENFLVLPDPKHEVSRSQAAVWSDGDRHILVNLSHATPIQINGLEIPVDTEVEIQFGDQIRIGSYLLRTEQVEPPAASIPPASAPPEPEPEESIPASPQEPADMLSLRAAFLRGAGVPEGTISSELTPELMELLGRLTAASIQGAIELIALRSLVKKEVKADLTMVVVRNNNPLKFFPDSQTVLIQMLRKKMPGFMSPVESIEDAYVDLRGHQMGVVAGMRATMNAMMGRLKPDNFEAKLSTPTLIEKLIPSKRQAAMWEMYSRQYESMADDAKDEFQTLFGAPFLAAYEREVERFKRGLPHG
ncbi:FHA domain-containing protein [Oxalobacteraceae bacterium GrIS 1.11]